MKVKVGVVALFLFIVIVACHIERTTALEPVPEKVEHSILKAVIDYSAVGEVALKLEKANPGNYEPEEIARLLSHWYSKILYLLPSPMPRMFLLQASNNALFYPMIKSGDHILRKAQIDDVIVLVKSLRNNNVMSHLSKIGFRN